MELHDAQSLAEFVTILKTEAGDSNATLGAKIGIGHATVQRILHGAKVDDETLDKIADYAGVTRAWIYELAKGIPTRPRYSKTVSILASLLEQAPPDVAEELLVVARALIESRKKKNAKMPKPDGDLARS